mmetsp:Transcript_84099/g.223244  ORF Transcript_84099/g.223244 Transcript_84099/m.223244 type:complete len:331 (+) Transcript_84099:222-1214(+)
MVASASAEQKATSSATVRQPGCTLSRRLHMSSTLASKAADLVTSSHVAESSDTLEDACTKEAACSACSASPEAFLLRFSASASSMPVITVLIAERSATPEAAVLSNPQYCLLAVSNLQAVGELASLQNSSNFWPRLSREVSFASNVISVGVCHAMTVQIFRYSSALTATLSLAGAATVAGAATSSLVLICATTGASLTGSSLAGSSFAGSGAASFSSTAFSTFCSTSFAFSSGSLCTTPTACFCKFSSAGGPSLETGAFLPTFAVALATLPNCFMRPAKGSMNCLVLAISSFITLRGFVWSLGSAGVNSDPAARPTRPKPNAARRTIGET